MTRTYTSYFTDDDGDVAALRAAITHLREDWEGRKPFISAATAAAGDARLAILEAGAKLLTDEVVE